MSGNGNVIFFWEFCDVPEYLGILGMGMKSVGMGIPTIWPPLMTRHFQSHVKSVAGCENMCFFENFSVNHVPSLASTMITEVIFLRKNR